MAKNKRLTKWWDEPTSTKDIEKVLSTKSKAKDVGKGNTVKKVANWLDQPAITIDVSKVSPIIKNTGKRVADHLLPGFFTSEEVTQKVTLVTQKVTPKERQKVTHVTPKVTPVTPKERQKERPPIATIVDTKYSLFEIEPSKLTTNTNVKWFFTSMSRLSSPINKRVEFKDGGVYYESPDTLWWEIHITQDAVKFFIAVPDKDIMTNTCTRQLKRTWKGVNVKPCTEEHIPSLEEETCSVTSLTMEHDSMLPLAMASNNYTPIDGIIGVKNFLKEGDECIIQIGMSSLGESWSNFARTQVEEAIKSERIPKKKGRQFSGKEVAVTTGNLVGLVAEEAMNLLGDFIIPGWEDTREFKESIRPFNGAGDSREMRIKAKSEGYKTTIRTVVVSKDPIVHTSVTRVVSSAFDPVANANNFVEVPTKKNHLGTMIEKVTKRRHNSLFGNVDVLCSIELSRLIHLPDAKIQAEFHNELKTVAHRSEIEMPNIVMQADEGSVPFMQYQCSDGTYKNTYRCGSNKDLLCMSTVIMGEPNSGKTTAAAGFVVDAFNAGYGSMTIDAADGKLVDNILNAIPPDKLDKVKILDFTNTDLPVGLGWNEAFKVGNRDVIEDRLVEELIYYLEMVSGNDFNMRSRQWVENAIKAVYVTPDATISDVEDMLSNADYRRSIIPTIEDPQLRADWERYSNVFSDTQRREIYDEAFRRLSSTMRKKVLKNFILQKPKKDSEGNYLVDLRKWMDEGYIVLVKANEVLGETIQTAIVSFLICKFNLAIIGREDIVNEDDRRPCFLVLDEPDHYIKGSERWRGMLTRYRKYRCGIMMMFHGWQQLVEADKNLPKIIRKSGPNYVIFKTDEDNLLEIKTVIEPEFKIKEIANSMPQYNAIVKLKMYDDKNNAVPAFMAKSLDPIKKRYKVQDNRFMYQKCAEELGVPKEEVMAELYARACGRSIDLATDYGSPEEELASAIEKVNGVPEEDIEEDEDSKRRRERRLVYEVGNYIDGQVERGEEPDEELVKHMEELLEEG